MEEMKSLFEGSLIKLGPIDLEKDPRVVAGWTIDPQMRMLLDGPPRPLSVESAKQVLETIEKMMDEKKDRFNFMLRNKTDDRLIGMAVIKKFDLTGISARLDLGIGDPADRRGGFGEDALNLLLGYSFGELSLHRVSAFSSADCTAMIGLLKKAGFKQEAIRRQAIYHDGRFWDELQMGLLREEWERMK